MEMVLHPRMHCQRTGNCFILLLLLPTNICKDLQVEHTYSGLTILGNAPRRRQIEIETTQNA